MELNGFGSLSARHKMEFQMKVTDANLPAKVCNGILLARKQCNLERSILPSHNIVIERLLLRELELHDAYSDLYKKLYRCDHPLFDALPDSVGPAVRLAVLDSTGLSPRNRTLQSLVPDLARRQAWLLQNERGQLTSFA